MSRLNWSQKGILSRPSFVEPVVDRSSLYSKNFSNLPQLHPHSVYRKPAVGSTVSGLIKPSCPTAITRLIITVVVFTVQRASSRCLSHIFKKSVKGGTPSVTHGDSSASIMFPVFSTLVRAPLNHVLPTSVRPGDVSASRVTVHNSMRSVSPKTPARLRFPGTQVTIPNNNDVTAITHTEGGSCPSNPFGISNYGESSKTFSSDVACGRHNDVSSIVVFSSGISASTGSRCDSRSKRKTDQVRNA